MGVPWNEEKKATLTRMLAAGNTFSEIARVFGDGTTRSAVAGQVLRMGLKSVNTWGGKPKTRRDAPKARPSTPVIRAAAPVAPVVERIAPVPVPECSPISPPIAAPVEPPHPRKAVTLIDAGFGQCRWIVRSDRTRSGRDLVCADPTLPGSSWCAAHRALCFTRAPKKTQAQLEADQKRHFAMMRKSGQLRAMA